MKKKETYNIIITNLLPNFKFPHSIAQNILIEVFAHFQCKPDNINIVFMDDNDIATINSKFLEHNYPTDVISFKLNDIADEENLMHESFPSNMRENTSDKKTTLEEQNYTLIEGEIYIGVNQAKHNSTFYGTKFYDEIKRVIIHGALHLIGFEDTNDVQKEEMTKWEDHFLSLQEPPHQSYPINKLIMGTQKDTKNKKMQEANIRKRKKLNNLISKIYKDISKIKRTNNFRNN